MRRRLAVFCVFLCCLALGCGPGKAEMDPFSIIIERKPFGRFKRPAPSPGVAPAPVPPPSFARYIRIVMMIQEGQTVRVGLVDLRSKSAKYHLLRVGETTRDGIKLVGADFNACTVVLQKGGDRQTVSTWGMGSRKAHRSANDRVYRRPGRIPVSRSRLGSLK